jgi:hypothetical protein
MIPIILEFLLGNALYICITLCLCIRTIYLFVEIQLVLRLPIGMMIGVVMVSLPFAELEADDHDSFASRFITLPDQACCLHASRHSITRL